MLVVDNSDVARSDQLPAKPCLPLNCHRRALDPVCLVSPRALFGLRLMRIVCEENGIVQIVQIVQIDALHCL